MNVDSIGKEYDPSMELVKYGYPQSRIFRQILRENRKDVYRDIKINKPYKIFELQLH